MLVRGGSGRLRLSPELSLDGDENLDGEMEVTLGAWTKETRVEGE